MRLKIKTGKCLFKQIFLSANAVALCLIATLTLAEPWRLVTESSDSRIYVDAGSVRPEGSYLSFAGRTIFRSGEEQLDGYFARCDVRLVALHTSLRYDSKGNNTASQTIPPNQIRVHPIPTGTPLAAQVEYVCSGRAMSERNAPDSIAQATPDSNEKRKDIPRTSESSGSGVIVGTQGEVLTNHHVVNGCSTISVKSDYGTSAARIVAFDPRLDVALLKTAQNFKAAITFRGMPPAGPGETVVALGYPLAGILASEANVSVGVISALAGIGNDTTRMQISAPVQPGNSGGPLLDSAGNLIGLVVSKLDSLRVAKITGDIPQNVNFAIKGDVIRLFLDANQLPVKTSNSSIRQDASVAASRGRGFTVQVTCS